MTASTAEAFMIANDQSPVVEGYVHGKGGEGGVYILEDGRSFDLSLEEMRKLPETYPDWGFWNPSTPLDTK